MNKENYTANLIWLRDHIVKAKIDELEHKHQELQSKIDVPDTWGKVLSIDKACAEQQIITNKMQDLVDIYYHINRLLQV